MDEIRETAIRIHKKLIDKRRNGIEWSEHDWQVWRQLRDLVLHSKEFDVD